MRSYEKMKDSEFERLLILSARLDNRSAPFTVRRRILAAVHPFLRAASAAGTLTASRALASVAPSTAAAGVAASLKLLGPALIIKCALGGLLGGAFVAGGFRLATSPSVATRAAQTSTVALSLPHLAGLPFENREGTRAASTGELSSLEVSKPVAVASGNQAAAAAVSPVNGGVGSAQSRPSAAAVSRRGAFALGAEVAMLDQARAALASGDGALAIRMLDDYKKRYRSGNLLPEATYIRVQALLKTGNQTAARAMAAHAQSMWPDSPVSKELSALVKSSVGPLP